MSTQPQSYLGEILVRRGVITAERLPGLYETMRERGQTLGQLVEDALRWELSAPASDAITPVPVLRGLVGRPVSCLSHTASTLPEYVQANGLAVRL